MQSKPRDSCFGYLCVWSHQTLSLGALKCFRVVLWNNLLVWEHRGAPEVFLSKQKYNDHFKHLSWKYHNNASSYIFVQFTVKRLLQKKQNYCAYYILKMMPQILSVQPSSLHQKCFLSWHLVVCKQSAFGPWAGPSAEYTISWKKKKLRRVFCDGSMYMLLLRFLKLIHFIIQT